MIESPVQILIVEGRFYADISDELLAGATQYLKAHGAEAQLVTVPGAFEIPAAISIAMEAAHRPTGQHFDGYVALGCVIRGETSHYDHVCEETARGIMELAVHKHLAIGFGLLTVENEEQAWARARRSEGDKGAAAAKACLDMIALKRTLAGERR